MASFSALLPTLAVGRLAPVGEAACRQVPTDGHSNATPTVTFSVRRFCRVMCGRGALFNAAAT